MQQRRLRLGDILDDYCPRERRITNHAVVAMIEDEVKQTRCTTCDADHEYKQARVPVRRKKDGGALLGEAGAGGPRPRACGSRARWGRRGRAGRDRVRRRVRSTPRTPRRMLPRNPLRSRPVTTTPRRRAPKRSPPKTHLQTATRTVPCIAASFAPRCRVPRGRRRSGRTPTSRSASQPVAVAGSRATATGIAPGAAAAAARHARRAALRASLPASAASDSRTRAPASGQPQGPGGNRGGGGRTGQGPGQGQGSRGQRPGGPGRKRGR